MLLELFPCGGGSVRYTKILAVIVRRPGPPWRYTAAGIPDHPDGRQQEEDTGRREDDVQKVDVISVPDALLFSHGFRC